MTIKARIYRPTKTAMQSGRGGTHDWILEFMNDSPVALDPLMGWCGSSDTSKQVRLEFASYKAAAAYAKHKGAVVETSPPHERRVRPKSYADNFAPKWLAR